MDVLKVCLLVVITIPHREEKNPKVCVKEREQAVGSGYDGKWKMENASSFVYSNKEIKMKMARKIST